MGMLRVRGGEEGREGKGQNGREEGLSTGLA